MEQLLSRDWQRSLSISARARVCVCSVSQWQSVSQVMIMSLMKPH